MTYERPFHRKSSMCAMCSACIRIEFRLKSNFRKSMLMNTILLFQLISTHLKYFMWKIHSEIWLILIFRICGNKCIQTGNWKRWWTSSKSTDDIIMRIENSTSMRFIIFIEADTLNKIVANIYESNASFLRFTKNMNENLGCYKSMNTNQHYTV